MINQYLASQANAITQQATQNLQNNILPGINSGAMVAGGFGGSRHGIAQSNAIGQTNQGITNSLAGMYGNAYAQDQQIDAQRGIADMQNQTTRDLGFGQLGLGQQNANTNQFQAQTSRDMGMGQLGISQQQTSNAYALGQGQLGLGNKQADNSYNLGLGQLGLGAQTADQNFYTQQRGQDLQGLGLGASLMNSGNSGLANQGQQLYQNGQQQQQAPWQNMQQFSNLLSQFSGLGGGTSNTTPGASAIGSALGGGITAAQLWQLLSGGKP